MKENQPNNQGSETAKRKTLLAALSKARGDRNSSSISSDKLDSENNDYYILTKEELNALVDGNIEKIENWVSNLDRRQATWLLRWLIKESS